MLGTLLALAALAFFALMFSARLRLALAICFAVLLAISPAYAGTTLQIDPGTINALSQLGAGIIVALGLMLWKWIDAHSPLKNSQVEQVARGAYMDLLDKAAQFGATQLDSGLTKVGTLDVGNAAVAAAANFAIAHGPDLAKALGVDITTPEGQAAIVRSVTARVGTLLGTAAANSAPIYRIALPAAVVPRTAPATT